MERLTNGDVAKIVRLLGDIASTTADLQTKQRILVTGLAELVGADYWLWIKARDDIEGRPPIGFMLLDGGWDSEAQKLTFAQGTISPACEIINCEYRKRYHVHFTARRSELIADRAWIESDLVKQFFKPAGVGEFITSIYPLGNKTFSSLSFFRAWGKPEFSPRDLCIIQLITGEIDWLHREGTDVPAAEFINKLSTRQRMVMILLLSGDSTKEIAQKLAISTYTVNDHIKEIHHRFGVSTRGELLSQFLSGKPTEP